jgi:hypothetical protein
VQTFLATKLAEYLSEKTHSEISIERLKISGLLHVELNNLVVIDEEDTLMLDAQRIKINMNLPALMDNQLHVRLLELDSVYFNLREDSRDQELNLTKLVNHFISETEDTTSSSMQITVDRLAIKGAHYKMDLYSAPNFDEGGMNYTHLDADSVNLVISDFYLDGDTLVGRMEKLSLKEMCGFILDDFSGMIRLSDKGINIDNFHIHSGSSWGYISKYSMIYPRWEAWLEFIDSVRFRAVVDSAQLNIDDIKYFSTTVAGMYDTLQFRGRVRGPISNLKVRKATINFKKNTHFTGNVTMTGLPDIEQTFVMIKTRSLQFNSWEANQFYLPGKKRLAMPEMLNRLGTIKVKGRFTGFYNDFVSNAQYQTDLGIIKTDLLLKPYGRHAKELEYKGKLVMTNFNIGRLLDNDMLGKITMVAGLNGSGIDELADATYDIDFSSIDIGEFSYKDVSIKGTIKEERIVAEMESSDGPFQLKSYGSFDYHDSLPAVELYADITNARIARLLLLNTDTLGMVSGKFDIKMEGSNLDNLTGSLAVDSLTYTVEDSKYFTDSIRLITKTENNYDRFIRLNSEWADANIFGQFRLSELELTYTILFKEIFPSLVKTYGIAEYENSEQDKLMENDHIHFDIDLKDTRDLYEIFFPAAKMAKGTKITGFYNLEMDSMEFQFVSPKVSYDRYYANNIKLNIVKSPRDLILNLESEYFKSKSIFAFDSMKINLFVERDTIDYHIKWGKRNNHSNSGNMNGTVMLTADEIDAYFEGGTFWINDTMWMLSDKGHLNYTYHNFKATDFSIYSDENSFDLYGSLSEKPDDILHFDFKNFDLSLLDFYLIENYFTDLDGHLTGRFELSNIWTQVGFSSEFNIQDFRLNKTYLGDASVNSLYSRSREAFVIDMKLQNQNDSIPVKYLDLGGFYYPYHKSNNFDLDLYFNQFPVRSLEAYLSSFTSLITGEINGKLKIRGSFDAPLVLGDLDANITAMRVDYLGTVYRLHDKLYFKENYFGFDNAYIYDPEYAHTQDHIGLATVHIKHHKYTDYSLFVDVRPSNLRVLDLKADQNDLFYGKAYGTGDFKLFGPFNNLTLTMNMKAGQNSKIAIPVASETVAEKADFITFIQHDDTIQIHNELDINQDDEFTIDMDMTMEVTPATQIEIVLDEVVGDKISARGKGTIRMLYDRQDNFNIYGKYIIDRGDYLFTMQNVLNKHFTIEPGSYIIWDGNLEDAQIKMKAIYRTEAKLYDLLQQVDQSEEFKKRASKVNCIIYLEGDLYSPSIKFDIELPDESMATRELVKQLLTLSNGENGSEELNRNFISLLVLGRFMPPSGYDAGTNPDALSKNATEMVANQVGNILNQLSDEVEIGVDWNPGDEMTTQEVAIALSYSMLNDRLIIDGRFGTGGGSTSPESAQRIVGDLNVEYKFTKDGRIRGRVFNRTNYYDPLTRKAPYTQGVGIVYRKEFDNLYELFHRTDAERREIERSEEAEELRKSERKKRKEKRTVDKQNRKAYRKKKKQQKENSTTE